MTVPARDGDLRRASPLEARLWGFVGAALIVGVLAVLTFAWNADRQRVASADKSVVIRVLPPLPELEPIP